MKDALKYKLAATAFCVVAVIAAAISISSHLQMRQMEKAVISAKQSADSSQKHAEEMEKKTYVYEEKIRYLEELLSENRRAAERLDDELEKLSAETDAARRAFGNRSGGTAKR